MGDYNDIEALLAGLLDDTKPINEVIGVEEPTITPPAPVEAAVEPEAPTAPEPEAPTAPPPEPVNSVFTDTQEEPVLVMPTFTTDEVAEALDIRNFATLATLNTKRWHAKAKDKQGSRDIAAANDADATAFETRKNLLAGADAKLRRIHGAIDAARAKYYEMTLPWTTKGADDVGRRTGARLLPNTMFMDFTAEMAQCKAEMLAALDDFVPDYPALVQQARVKLGKRFDIADYPNAESIRNHFDLSFDFQPVPMGDDFKGLPTQQANALANAIESKTRKQVEIAMQDLWTRIHESVGRMAERLSHPDKLFHHTLVSNVRTVAAQLGHLNVTGDKRITKLKDYIDKHLCHTEVEDLRKNPVVRAQVGAHAQTVLDMMAKFAKGV